MDSINILYGVVCVGVGVCLGAYSGFKIGYSYCFSRSKQLLMDVAVSAKEFHAQCVDYAQDNEEGES